MSSNQIQSQMSSSTANSSPFFKSVTLPDSLKYTECNHATHCMIYSTPDSNGISYGLLQMRFDGLIGFVGGGVDVENVTIEHIIDAMNRELEEEINYSFENVTQEEWICSHRDNTAPFVQHFFAKELSYERLLQIGKTHVKAHHFPIESLGLLFVPIISFGSKKSSVSQRFLNNFLRQRFAGNGKQQFIESLRKRKFLSDKQIIELQDISKSVSNESDIKNNVIKGTEVKAMLTTNTGVEYYGETVDVIYGLMIIRDSGLFDFVGTKFVDLKDNNLMIETINDSLKSDLGFHCQRKDSFKDSIELSFDNDFSHVFQIQLKSTEFTEIETNFTETENFNQTSFGIFRIPLQLKGHTKKADNYVKRFLNGFLNQEFVNNSKTHLKSVFEKMN